MCWRPIADVRKLALIDSGYFFFYPSNLPIMLRRPNQRTLPPPWCMDQIRGIAASEKYQLTSSEAPGSSLSRTRLASVYVDLC